VVMEQASTRPSSQICVCRKNKKTGFFWFFCTSLGTIVRESRISGPKVRGSVFLVFFFFFFLDNAILEVRFLAIQRRPYIIKNGFN
jgi:hypothetical protein